MGWVPTRWVGGEEGGFEKLREVGSLFGFEVVGLVAILRSSRGGVVHRGIPRWYQQQ